MGPCLELICIFVMQQRCESCATVTQSTIRYLPNPNKQIHKSHSPMLLYCFFIHLLVYLIVLETVVAHSMNYTES